MKRGPQAVVVSAAFSFIAFCVVVLRMYCRYWLVKRTGPDDYLVIVASVLSILLTVCIGFEQRHGLGEHIHTVDPEEFKRMSIWFFVSILVYNFGLTAVKSSVITQLLRLIFHSRFRKFCWFVLGLICSYSVVGGLVAIFSCHPVSYFWDKSIQGGRCINLLAFWYSCAAFNIITDIMVLSIPLSVFRSLQLPKRQKFCLMLVFALGGFGCVTSILRLHSIYVVAHSMDITWDNVGAATWSSVEVDIAIICACLPTLKPLLKMISPRLLSTRGSASNQGIPRIDERQPTQQSYEGLDSSVSSDEKTCDA